MEVTFKRTGERRYAVIIVQAGQTQSMNPAPGYDDHIPHDLVHYAVEAELGIVTGVFGRAALGAGNFISAADPAQTARERARAQRKKQRREHALGKGDKARTRDMADSERLAAICDLMWRRRHGQQPDATRPRPAEALHEEDAARVQRVVERLDRLATLWRELPVQGCLTFEWPSLEPRTQQVARGPV